MNDLTINIFQPLNLRIEGELPFSEFLAIMLFSQNRQKNIEIPNVQLFSACKTDS